MWFNSLSSSDLYDIYNSLIRSDIITLKSFIATSVLCYGKKGAKHSKPRKASAEKLDMKLTSVQQDILVGSMLGDGHMEKQGIGPRYNPRLQFVQSFPMHAAYLTILYIHFHNMVKTPPKVITRKPDARTGNIYSTISFKTLAYPCFNYWYDLFYINKIKVVPSNIASLLTPRALAYWIMDDGSKGTWGEMILHTRSFTLAEVELLQAALLSNFGLESRNYEKVPNQWVIIIPNSQSRRLKDLVSHHICRSMLYKL